MPSLDCLQGQHHQTQCTSGSYASIQNRNFFRNSYRCISDQYVSKPVWCVVYDQTARYAQFYPRFVFTGHSYLHSWSYSHVFFLNLKVTRYLIDLTKYLNQSEFSLNYSSRIRTRITVQAGLHCQERCKILQIACITIL